MPTFFQHGSNRFLDVIRFGNVGSNGDSVDSFAGQLARNFLGSWEGNINDGNGRPGLAQAMGKPSTDTLSTSRDESNSPVDAKTFEDRYSGQTGIRHVVGLS